MTEDRFEFLLAQFKADNLTQAEWEELRNAISNEQFDSRLKEDFLHILESGSKHPTWSVELQESIWQEILNGRQADKAYSSLPPKLKLATKNPLRFRRHFQRFAAIAASLILFFTSLWLFWPNNKPLAKKTVAKLAIKPTDIAPGSNKAILTLANGSRIILDLSLIHI